MAQVISDLITVMFAAPWAQPIREVLVSRDDKATALIPDLHPASTYTLRVIAQNAIGLSPPSSEITYSTREESGCLSCIKTNKYRINICPFLNQIYHVESYRIKQWLVYFSSFWSTKRCSSITTGIQIPEGHVGATTDG